MPGMRTIGRFAIARSKSNAKFDGAATRRAQST
jgi:hypothetical protein